jgi:hypothetical protein
MEYHYAVSSEGDDVCWMAQVHTMFEGTTGVPQNRFWSDRTTNNRMVDLCILKMSRGVQSIMHWR